MQQGVQNEVHAETLSGVRVIVCDLVDNCVMENLSSKHCYTPLCHLIAGDSMVFSASSRGSSFKADDGANYLVDAGKQQLYASLCQCHIDAVRSQTKAEWGKIIQQI